MEYLLIPYKMKKAVANYWLSGLKENQGVLMPDMTNLFGRQLNRMNIGNINTTLAFIKRIIEDLLVFDQFSLCQARPFGNYGCEWKPGWITVKTG